MLEDFCLARTSCSRYLLEMSGRLGRNGSMELTPPKMI